MKYPRYENIRKIREMRKSGTIFHIRDTGLRNKSNFRPEEEYRIENMKSTHKEVSHWFCRIISTNYYELWFPRLECDFTGSAELLW